jgi:hypothetical protein
MSAMGPQLSFPEYLQWVESELLLLNATIVASPVLPWSSYQRR